MVATDNIKMEIIQGGTDNQLQQIIRILPNLGARFADGADNETQRFLNRINVSFLYARREKTDDICLLYCSMPSVALSRRSGQSPDVATACGGVKIP